MLYCVCVMTSIWVTVQLCGLTVCEINTTLSSLHMFYSRTKRRMWQVTNYALKHLKACYYCRHATVNVSVCLLNHVQPNSWIESQLMVQRELALVNAEHVYKLRPETALNEADRACHFNK